MATSRPPDRRQELVRHLTTRFNLSPDRAQRVADVEELSGQQLLKCYQCGKCSAGCPLAFVMANPPSQLIRLLQIGLVDEAIASASMWQCASCLACDVRCPKGIDISRIMDALRAIQLRNHIEEVDIDRLNREFVAEVPQQALIAGFRKFTD